MDVFPTTATAAASAAKRHGKHYAIDTGRHAAVSHGGLASLLQVGRLAILVIDAIRDRSARVAETNLSTECLVVITVRKVRFRTHADTTLRLETNFLTSPRDSYAYTTTDHTAETRPEWTDRPFHYDSRRTIKNRRVYIDAIFLDDDPTDPYVHIVSMRDA